MGDRAPVFSAKNARDFIQRELGAPVGILFRKFEAGSIAAASLGQVHRAILCSRDKVVVKVQRPGLKKLFDVDFRKLLYQEIDYINEGKNADRFRRDFRNVKWVRVPMVYWDYTAMKINDVDMIDARGYNRTLISSRAIEEYLIQVMQSLIDLGALQPTGDLSLVRRSIRIFLDNLLSQTPDQQQTLSAIGELAAKLQIYEHSIGYTLDPDFSFAKVTAPYAQELLDTRQKQRSGTQLVEELRKQADDK
ncbi:hypothetical protein ACLOJK_031033 [Asimina triloba]